MQKDPLLVQLDWFFTTAGWTIKYPNSVVNPLARPVSDHIPCVVSISSKIPKASVFRFENYWIRQPGFYDVVENVWATQISGNSAKTLTAKLKILRKALKKWNGNISNMDSMLASCDRTIAMMDEYEDSRPLHITEWNFRLIIKARFLHLTNCKRDLWKNRCTIRWARLGDENTAFFHSMATVRYRQNNIAKFIMSDGREVSEHEEKAAILWGAYKERLGQVSTICFPESLENLIVPVQGLQGLSAPFSTTEIDDIIKHLPTDKAPGPDGFNGMFIKKCWHIIKYDFYNLCKDFQQGNIDLTSINDSLITLIPKKSSPETPNDYRPISLLNSSIKLITKLLANRLQEVILKGVHRNQYGFLKTRNIQDCLGWAFEYLHQCKQSGKRIVVLKIDFQKAFDMMEHAAILKILKLKGYDDIWLQWISNIMSTGTSSILLNGVPGKNFSCKRGVRQGDPLSPLLFVETADLLQTMINFHFHQDSLVAPLPIPNHDFPIIQYADDTLVVMEACPNQLFLMKTIINDFAAATGLEVNYAKSSLVSINCSDDETAQLAAILGCQVGQMPFTYLGLPLGTTRPTIQDLSPLVDSIERRLNAVSRFLSYAGRLTYIDSVLSALPTFYMCSIKLQKTLIKTIDRGRRHCLWAKTDDNMNVTCNSLVAWDKVCRPKAVGGLGVINLQLQNDALLLKHLHKFMNRAAVPWVELVWHCYYQNKVPQASIRVGSFWWKDISSLFWQYRGVTQCSPGNGSSTLMWKDKWTDQGILASDFERLFSFALDPDISLQTALHTAHLPSLFFLPLSEQAYDEMQQLSLTLHELNQDQQAREGFDRWIYQTNSEKYTPASYYKQMFQGLQQHGIYTKLWKCKSLPKHKVFTWLMINDRLNTRDLMIRKHWQLNSSSDCVLCNHQELEDRDHLFLECPFAQRCWSFLKVNWIQRGSLLDSLLATRAGHTGPCFLEVAISAIWNLWKCRNDFIFEQLVPSFRKWKALFLRDINLIYYRLKSPKKQALITWIGSI